MLRLIIDTSSEYSLVGVAEGSVLLASSIQLHANQLSRLLLPTIAALLKETGLSVHDLNGIAVGVGPGSYTGTRVGVAVGKSLAFALNIPLRGFCSLLAFLSDCPPRFACVMPSKTGDYFLLKGSSSEHALHVSFSALVTSVTLLEELKNVDGILGKPLVELHKAFPDLTGPWLEPLPNFKTPMRFLEIPSAQTETIDLIYLHRP